MYFDGAFSLQGTRAGVLLVAPTGEHLKYVVQMHFPKEQATNNTTEYEGLLAGLRIAAELGIKKLIVRGDSQLVVRQVNKDYQSPLMEAYIDEVRKLEEHLTAYRWNTFQELRMTLQMACQSVPHSSYLWNQELLCSS